MPSIVTVNVSQTVAPTPNNLQATGAFISQGATTLSAGSYSLLTQLSALTPLLAVPLNISAIVWSGGVAQVTTATPIPGLVATDNFLVTIAQCSPQGYNGTFKATVTGTNIFTYALTNNPGTLTVAGTYTPPNQTELQAMANTFFAQGSNRAVYVLELGPADGTSGPPLLTTFIATNPGMFYAYLVPGNWDSTAAFLAMIQGFESLTAKTYFFVDTTTSTYTNYTGAMKCIFALVPVTVANGRPPTEHTSAAPFQHFLGYAPSSTNRVTPFAFSYMFGVTPYPTLGNSVLLTQLKAASINYIGTGAEGGISNTILFWGTTKDGNDATYWYSADWAQINGDLVISNAVINGSNNPLAPLYYDQNGINQLQDVLVQMAATGVADGLATGTVTRTALDPISFANNLNNNVYEDQLVINAVPFVTYTTTNVSAYGAGFYGGLSVVWIPARGFTSITFNLDVTDLLTQ